MKLLVSFAALSMASSVILSLLPEGGLKRTAGMAVGLLSVLCWAEGLSGLLGINLAAELPDSVLAPTYVSIQQAETHAAEEILSRWEAEP